MGFLILEKGDYLRSSLKVIKPSWLRTAVEEAESHAPNDCVRIADRKQWLPSFKQITWSLCEQPMQTWPSPRMYQSVARARLLFVRLSFIMEDPSDGASYIFGRGQKRNSMHGGGAE